ncbi:MAG: hypothetical protein CVV02_01410 [Firmicutes bacterium HGW-Firmicutes-7]|nr:MAG: hypothetical protein CVV02_01410 [Firmicutes bacterium HGW-Firmicutes-7]
MKEIYGISSICPKSSMKTSRNITKWRGFNFKVGIKDKLILILENKVKLRLVLAFNECFNIFIKRPPFILILYYMYQCHILVILMKKIIVFVKGNKEYLYY